MPSLPGRNVRLFVAVLLEPVVLDILTDLQGQMRRLDTAGSVRWVDPHGIHLTLKFLGQVSEARLDPVCTGISRAVEGMQAPTLALGALGAFPSPHRPRVLWVGIREGARQLQPLALAVDTAMHDLGWEKEERSFQPHLTVGRVRETARREATRALVEAIARLVVPETPALRHPRLALVQSHLGPAGARYEELRVWLLE